MLTTPNDPTPTAAADLAARLKTQIVEQLQQRASLAAKSQQAHAELLHSIVAKTTASVTEPYPIANDIAAILGAPIAADSLNTAPTSASWSALLAALNQLTARLASIQDTNTHLCGRGTIDDPYVVTTGPLYLQAPVTVAFAGVPPAQLQLKTAGNQLLASA